MQILINHIAEALRSIDSSGEQFKKFRPGVGPFGEPQLLKQTVRFLREHYPERYGRAKTKRIPDILIPGKWALECKIVRPFGDNDKEAEHWSQNLLHPYEGNVSLIGDAFKLINSNMPERKGLIVFAYEHEPPKIDVELLVRCFELIADQVLAIPLTERFSARVDNLIHPVHMRSTIYGWEINIKNNSRIT